jgi:hypothetical protein
MSAKLIQAELADRPPEASIARGVRPVARDGLQAEPPEPGAPFARILIVPHDHLFIGGDAQVELESICSLRKRTLERSDRVLDLVLGRATMADHPEVTAWSRVTAWRRNEGHQSHALLIATGDQIFDYQL